MNPGDRVEFTEKARKQFPWHVAHGKTVGVFVGMRSDGLVYVAFDGSTRAIRWHESFWQLVNGDSCVCPTCGQQLPPPQKPK